MGGSKFRNWKRVCQVFFITRRGDANIFVDISYVRKC